MKKISRKTLCHCGSGKKYKNCHGKKSGGKSFTTAPVILFTVVVAIAFFVIISDVSSDNSTTQGAFTPQPPGPAPQGKVWSPEHGHWHNIAPTQQQSSGPLYPQPPGSVPEGKVWSTEHGHWHDVSIN